PEAWIDLNDEWLPGSCVIAKINMGNAVPAEPFHDLANCVKHKIVFQEGNAPWRSKPARAWDEAALDGVGQYLPLTTQDTAINVISSNESLNDILQWFPTIPQELEERPTVGESLYSPTIASNRWFEQDRKGKAAQRLDELLPVRSKQRGRMRQTVLRQ